MKSSILILVILLSSVGFGFITNQSHKDYKYNNSSIRDSVIHLIEKGVIGNKHLFIINENKIEEPEITKKLNSIKQDDIISITILNKTESKRLFGSSGKDGAVKINYYIDSLLKPEYYVSNNNKILNQIEDLIKQEKVVRYPLIILSGVPLRGIEIKENLDKLDNNSVKSIDVLKLQIGLQVYGERAINGAIIIDTK